MLIFQYDVPYYFPSVDLYADTAEEAWKIIREDKRLREDVDIGQDGELIFDVPGTQRPAWFIDGLALEAWLNKKRKRGKPTYLRSYGLS